VGIACFELIPEQLLRIFTAEPAVLEIGVQAFHIIGISFLPAVPSLILPVFFQAIGAALPSVLLSLTRQIFCLIPVFWLFSRIDLAYTWLAFPIAEVVRSSCSGISSKQAIPTSMKDMASRTEFFTTRRQRP